MSADGRRANELAVLYDITRDLGTQPDLPTLLDAIAERALALLAAPAGNIYLYDAQRRELEQVAGKSAVPLGTRLHLGEGVAGQVAETLQPVLVHDYRTWAHRSAHYEGVAVTAVVGVPMLYGADLIGVLAVAEIGTAQRQFTTADMHLLALFAGLAASAVYNARLFVETRLLEELDRLRTDFIATLSHNLRTPLTAVRAGIGLLETSSSARLRTDERQLLENVQRNVARLGLQIDDLLAFNQLEARALRLDRARLDVRDVVRGAVSAMSPLIDAKNQVLHVDLLDPLLAEADPQRLEQAVVNVLANAHQHTPSGTHIEISGRVLANDIVLKVGDTGPGIPPQDLKRVFQRFQRLPGPTGGSGLGLAIAHGIMELHGGRIWAESQPGSRTTFYMTLPAAKAAGSSEHRRAGDP
jgi:two-component system sensor histidine kinase KdpD